MKFVSTSDWRNTSPEVAEIDEPLHDAHVHKGARLSIGGDVPFEKLSAAQKKLVAQLNSAGRLVDASNAEKVKIIDTEVTAEKKAAEKLAAKETIKK